MESPYSRGNKPTPSSFPFQLPSSIPNTSIKNKMFNRKDITQQKGWVCVMEDGTTIEVEGFSEAHKIPNKKALMSTEFYPQYSQLSPPKKRS
jgi:hypothetical protein